MMSILLNSRLALIGVTLFLCLGWHYVDKAAAVRSAEEELADQAEIKRLKAERDEAKRRAVIEAVAKAKLQIMMADAKADAEQAEKELDDYVQSTDQNTECVVDTRLLERLRN